MVLRCCDEVRTAFRNLYCGRGDSLKVNALDRIDIQTSITSPYTSLEEAARLSTCEHHLILSVKLSIANSKLTETVSQQSENCSGEQADVERNQNANSYFIRQQTREAKFGKGEFASSNSPCKKWREHTLFYNSIWLQKTLQQSHERTSPASILAGDIHKVGPS